MALAIELKKRGHDPCVATSEIYRPKIESAGVSFSPVRPDVGDLLSRPDLIEKIWHPRSGPDFLVREYLLPVLGQSFEDLINVCRGADLFLSHPAGYAGPIVAELLKLRWLSVVLQPMIFVSAFDPPFAGGLRTLYKLSGSVGRLALRLGKRVAEGWMQPVYALRKRVGLPARNGNPLFEGQFSPYGTLALFSRQFASPQRDWPPHTHITGFPFYDRLGPLRTGISEDYTALTRFLDEGPPPVLFTLGSSAVMHPEAFFQQSLEAAARFRFRAILLVGESGRAALPDRLPPDVHVASYAPYSQVMPRCCAIVHQGGIGTTAQALRAGKPMVIVPWSYDQPDNAERARKLGVSETLRRSRYNAQHVGQALETVLDDRQGHAKRAMEIGRRIAAEDGVASACDAIDRTLETSSD